MQSPVGRAFSRQNGRGEVTRFAQGARHRVAAIDHPIGGDEGFAYSSEVARFEYAYDARGNRREERRIDASGTQRTTYDYDKDDRLTGTTVTAPDSSVTETRYTLDPVGNRRQEVVRRNGATVSDIAYTYQAYQRLTETRDGVSGVLTEYTYDARGHLVSETRNGQTTIYRPNAQDRLATLTLPGAPPVEIEYAYDSEGKRVERRTPTELTRFGWDGQTLRRETNAANNVIEAHDWAAGRILSSRRLNDTRYAQHDALRSPIRWSQSTGAEQGQLRYDAWGETTETHPDLPRIAYTGHYREREGTAYYAQQRYYRPGLGRFNRVDPWSGNETNPITLNKYLYANGNPLIYVDLDGRCAGNPNAEFALGPVACQEMTAEMLGVDPYTREGIQAVNRHDAEIAQMQMTAMAGVGVGGAIATGFRLIGTEILKYGLRGALMSRPEAVVSVGGEIAAAGAALAAGADIPQTTPLDSGQRVLAQTARSLDEGLDALRQLQRGPSQAELPQASLLSSSAAPSRVAAQRAEPLTIVEGGASPSTSAATISSPLQGMGDTASSPWLLDKRAGVRFHLEEFRQGGSFLVPETPYRRFIEGQPMIGRTDGQFITTSREMDMIIQKTGGDVGEISKLLGTRWNEPLYRIDIPSPLLRNARLPSGFESGADPELFRWGGMTSGGRNEIVVDPIPAGEFVAYPLRVQE